jgi:glycosyl transferase, family 25
MRRMAEGAGGGPVAGLQTWVINLDRAPERWQRVSARLAEIGLPATRFPAVDARAFTPEQQARLDAAAFARLHGMTPLPGELGCYLSHVEVMRRMLAGDAEFALILEDDVLVTDRLPAALDGLARHAGRWDMVKLSAVHSGTPRRVLEAAPGQHLAVMWSRCTGSSAYVINRRAARAYLDPERGLLPMQLPYDHVFDQGWRFGLKVRLLVPTPCVHDEQTASTIAAPSGTPTRKFHWTKRLSTFGYRLRNEGRRLVYAVSESWRERR